VLSFGARAARAASVESNFFGPRGGFFRLVAPFFCVDPDGGWLA